MSRCKACRAPVRWAKTEGGKTIPLDVETRVGGNLMIVNEPIGGPPVVRVVPVEPGVRRYFAHFASCPAAASFRKPKAVAAP